mmetsp:Transcript_5422/g.7845  ORF Transcript_5422/g.7845 Transcript_5422/m.7845 type:complete len:333 (-) Transcript_5422:77-1075(-)
MMNDWISEKYTPTNNNDATMFNNLGNNHFDQGNFDEAIDAYYHGLEIERRKLEPTHQNIIVTLSNISETYRQLGDFELAIETYIQVLVLQREKFGVLHPETAKTLHVIGLIHDQMGNLPYALECIECVISLQRNFNCKPEQRNLSTSLTHAGCIFFRMNMIYAALKYLHEALLIERNRGDIEDMAFILYNMGLCYQAKGSLKSAIRCYTESLELEIRTIGKDHKDISATMFKLGEVYSAVGQFDEALLFFQNALGVGRKQEKNKKMDSVTESRILIEIGYIHCYQGDVSSVRGILGELAVMEKEIGLSQVNMMLYRFLQTSSLSCWYLASAA